MPRFAQSTLDELLLSKLFWDEQEVQHTLQSLHSEATEDQLPVLEARRDEISSRLDDLGIGAKLKPIKHTDEKSETHRDFLLKEMVMLIKNLWSQLCLTPNSIV